MAKTQLREFGKFLDICVAPTAIHAIAYRQAKYSCTSASENNNLDYVDVN